jgi:hypothetical protein
MSAVVWIDAWPANTCAALVAGVAHDVGDRGMPGRVHRQMLDAGPIEASVPPTVRGRVGHRAAPVSPRDCAGTFGEQQVLVRLRLVQFNVGVEGRSQLGVLYRDGAPFGDTSMLRPAGSWSDEAWFTWMLITGPRRRSSFAVQDL